MTSTCSASATALPSASRSDDSLLDFDVDDSGAEHHEIAVTADDAVTGLARGFGAKTRRRGFLRQLASLPLICGSLSLLGTPSAVAVPVTPDLLEAYKTWLHNELQWLAWEMAGDPVHQERYRNFGLVHGRPALSRHIRGCLLHVGRSGSYHGGDEPPPSSRAALVMSAVGCDWRGGL